LLAAALTCLLLGGCVSKTVRVVDMTPPRQAATALAEHQLLDVGIAIFDENVPDDYDERIEKVIMPEVRRAEAKYIPYFAKNLLQSTGNWGAVRVIPRETHAVDVTVTGKILHSDGESLELTAAVRDATGTVWFERTYAALASKYAYEETMPRDIDAFQAIYKELSDDMLTYREKLTEAEVANIRRTAELKFAREFSADAFSDHIEQTADGEFKIARLPSEDDPMLARVRKVREREYLFIDTLDDYYGNYNRQMFPAYQDWRRASYTEAISIKELKAQATARTIGGTLAIVGGIAGIYESSDAYVDASGIVSIVGGVTLITSAIAKRQEAAQQAERLRELGSAAEAELVPTTIEVENQTARLEGNVAEQYAELRRILRRVYFEDLGLPPPEDLESLVDEEP
jgi:hypothetical protein